MTRNAGLALLLVSLAAVRASVAADDDPADVVVRKWLVLPTVDVSARRPLQPNAVFAKHLLDRASPPPKEGEEIVGTLGKPAKWLARDADVSEKKDDDGFVAADGIDWAYASVESAGDRVAIAKLEGAGVLFVGGAGFTGDVYRLGDAGVPVALKKGANDVYVGGVRGGFRLTLVSAKSSFNVSRGDRDWLNKTVCDESRTVAYDQVGDWLSSSELLLSSRRLLNVTTSAITPEGSSGPSFVPLGVRSDRPSERDRPSIEDGLQLDKPKLGAPYRRTFVSSIDGSVQSYAVVPPTPSDIDKSKLGLVLSLHGAGVECMSQARAYAPKPDFWIVCPTNRGNFGFDWQDWGRLDAYEVLADALKVTGVDPRRVYLTGHSMGGHGTWHLAANDPDRFLAIAPSAGWSGFDSYGNSQAMSPLAWMWRAADGASRTLDLVGNLAQVPTYVLHGEKDDNVPASEARLMIDAVTKSGGKPESHFEPGAGHWWDKDEKRPGADCVDWPGIWELFRRTQPPERTTTTQFASMDLSVHSKNHWIDVRQLADYARPFKVRTSDGADGAFVITTDNVRTFSLDCTHPDAIVDGARCEVTHGNWPLFVRGAKGCWTMSAPEPAANEKRPERCGPFKRAFANRFVLVYGTAGDEAETRELLEKARYDSEVWAYRANGDANLMSDAQFLADDFKDRNVIVYGNADTNRAWSAVFDDDCPIKASRGAMTVNGAKHEGVVAAAFVRPRKGSGVGLAAAFADTGAAATRLFYSFPVFGSGFGIPDYVVFGPGYLREMDGDVRSAGWFDYAWRMK